MLRGSRDYASLAACRTWLREALWRRNATRGERLEAERALLHPLPSRRLPSYREIDARVGQGSTIRVMGHAYSVPSRLIGARVRVRVHETRVEILFADHLEIDVERGRGKNGAAIQYRHVIHSLVRKPGAFRCYRHREPMRRAVAARTGSAKKIHACAPFPDRDRSSVTALPASRHESRSERTSSCHVPSSKSAARSQQVSSSRSG